MKLLLATFRYFFGLYKRFRLWRLGVNPSWQHVPAGYEMFIDPTQWLDQRMLFGVYEPWLRTMLETALRPGDVCIDVGTHKGYFTLLMASRVGETGRVFAFDPDPRAFGALEQNRNRNQFDWVRCQSLAIGEREGTIEIELTPKLGDTSRFHRAEYDDEELKRVSVEMFPLEQALARGGFDSEARVALIKIDAEGSEPFILQGMHTFLEEQSPILVMEFHFACLTEAGSSAAEVYDQLQALGYTGYRMTWNWSIFGASVVRLVPLVFGEDDGETVDAVLVREDSPYRARIEALIT